ncbi:2-oxoglutarate dehydrogenase E1 [Paenibacillus kandeliae]|uniref:2-oxoglutarate dehydrogenase E1 n=1 Tax=Paenibacillus kandeliae TaxID=3231269 RepID=UPI003457AB00
MKAITIRQPWATLVSLGEKQYETRSWKTTWRGQLAIHAGKTVDKDAFQNVYVREALERHGYLTMADLPTSSVIAIAKVMNCWQAIEALPSGCILENGQHITDPEWTFGDFTIGRYAWDMEVIEQLKTPIPAKGKLSLWEWGETL